MKLGKMFLGIELGSTRIKCVIIGEDFLPVATGACEWENRLENGYWTYSLDDVWAGIRASFREMAAEFEAKFSAPLNTVGAIGISAMMHGYLVFGENDVQLVPFRTWRNTTTEKAAAELTSLYNFNIPQRWSVAHLRQAQLDGEEHVPQIAFMTTLAGYVHWKLTGEKVLGIGDASGMYPAENGAWKRFAQNDYLPDFGIFPQIKCAGEYAGLLTEEGAKFLDPTGTLKPGIPLCPPEGDAGTGMVATNSVSPRTGNVSAGTSIFAMIVLENELKNLHTEIDIVTTPTGKNVAMVHCNNCSSDIDAWVRLLTEALAAFGVSPPKNDVYEKLYLAALDGDSDCGGLMAYNFVSGEPIVGVEAGKPSFARTPDANFNLANFMRTHLFSAMAALRLGMEILRDEGVFVDILQAHGGLFKTPVVAQRLMAAALNTPVSVLQSAGEGGAWGAALLAAYMHHNDVPLEEFLQKSVFAKVNSTAVSPDPADVSGFEKFLQGYKEGLKK
jgi:sugar (pentulose or hexulose) kinase